MYFCCFWMEISSKLDYQMCSKSFRPKSSYCKIDPWRQRSCSEGEVEGGPFGRLVSRRNVGSCLFEFCLFRFWKRPESSTIIFSPRNRAEKWVEIMFVHMYAVLRQDVYICTCRHCAYFYILAKGR
jgi:hypothetical protein